MYCTVRRQVQIESVPRRSTDLCAVYSRSLDGMDYEAVQRGKSRVDDKSLFFFNGVLSSDSSTKRDNMRGNMVVVERCRSVHSHKTFHFWDIKRESVRLSPRGTSQSFFQ